MQKMLKVPSKEDVEMLKSDQYGKYDQIIFAFLASDEPILEYVPDDNTLKLENIRRSLTRAISNYNYPITTKIRNDRLFLIRLDI